MATPVIHSPSGLYAFAECEVVNTQNGGVMLVDKHSDAQLLVAGPVAQAMQACGQFRTLEEHTEVLTESFTELKGQHADVMAVLNMIKDAGLMVTAESVCERLNGDVPPALDMPPTRVFIITCDRPEAVKRLLESMLRAGNLSHHEAIVLIDDSRDATNAAENREAVENFNLTSPRDMHYFGAEEAKQFMGDLISAAPDQEEAIRFLIDRERWADKKTYGLARNFSLLLSVGCRAIVMDDDVICATVESLHKEAGLQFGYSPREVDFFKDQQDLISHTSRADFDPLTGHAKCLGLNLGQSIAKLTGRPVQPEDIKGSRAPYLSLWDIHSRVIVTQCGTAGDPGTPGTEWIYSLDPKSEKRLQDFPGGLQGALSSRSYLMVHPRPMITKMSVMSQVTGLDNSALLPPYFPVFRGEDYTFGAMTEYMHPNAAVLEYDWGIPHLPVDERTGDPSPEPPSGKGLLNINKYITDRTVYQPGIPADVRMRSLAAIVKELSNIDDRGLKTIYRREVGETQGMEFSRLNAYLQDGSIRPPQWQHWLEESLKNLSAALQAPAEITHFNDIGSTMSAEQALQVFRELAGQFATAIGDWEAIRSAAPDCASKQINRA